MASQPLCPSLVEGGCRPWVWGQFLLGWLELDFPSLSNMLLCLYTSSLLRLRCTPTLFFCSFSGFSLSTIPIPALTKVGEGSLPTSIGGDGRSRGWVAWWSQGSLSCYAFDPLCGTLSRGLSGVFSLFELLGYAFGWVEWKVGHASWSFSSLTPTSRLGHGEGIQEHLEQGWAKLFL